VSYAAKRNLYEGLPGVLKKPFGWVPFKFLAGKEYRRTVQRGAEIDRASRADILAYQEKALGRMLTFACDQVPAYQPLRATVDRLRPFEALKAFPFQDKQTLQSDFERFLPRNFDKIPHYECTTGGTSGNQLKFYLDKHAHSIEQAFIHRMWARMGYTPRSRKGTFRGVSFPNLKEGIYWQMNPVYRELQFSPFHMSDNTLSQYIEQLQRFRPQFLHGYPSAITLLAEYVLRHGISLDDLSLKAILLGSEALYPGQRETLEKAFACRAFSWYGHSEQLILGGECETSTVYHHFPDYGILEIVDDAGNVLHDDGARGDLVGTGLRNFCLPLIRYRTEDRARRRSHACECGRNFDRFDEVEGRWRQEYVIGKTGARISPAALNMHGPMFAEVARYQYYQNTPGVMVLRIMVTERFSDAHAQTLREAFSNKVGDELVVEIQIVESITLTGIGKMRRLIQEIPPASMR